jgi:mannose-6-phosphate isomerase-like protein (cupin superfamily)
MRTCSPSHCGLGNTWSCRPSSPSRIVATQAFTPYSAPSFPDRGENGPKTTFFPGLGGYRFFILTIPPGDGHANLEGVDVEAGLRELQEKLPGVLETNEFDNPGMHTTDTVDMEIVLSGEVVLELDNGVERTLHTGDVNIQNGTRHRWHNRGTEPATMAVAVVGARRG